jgi:hypothetical protein
MMLESNHTYISPTRLFTTHHWTTRGQLSHGTTVRATYRDAQYLFRDLKLHFFLLECSLRAAIQYERMSSGKAYVIIAKTWCQNNNKTRVCQPRLSSVSLFTRFVTEQGWLTMYIHCLPVKKTENIPTPRSPAACKQPRQSSWSMSHSH